MKLNMVRAIPSKENLTLQYYICSKMQNPKLSVGKNFPNDITHDDSMCSTPNTAIFFSNAIDHENDYV